MIQKLSIPLQGADIHCVTYTFCAERHVTEFAFRHNNRSALAFPIGTDCIRSQGYRGQAPDVPAG
jgi:hypothetical protein